MGRPSGRIRNLMKPTAWTSIRAVDIQALVPVGSVSSNERRKPISRTSTTKTTASNRHEEPKRHLKARADMGGMGFIENNKAL